MSALILSEQLCLVTWRWFTLTKVFKLRHKVLKVIKIHEYEKRLSFDLFASWFSEKKYPSSLIPAEQLYLLE